MWHTAPEGSITSVFLVHGHIAPVTVGASVALCSSESNLNRQTAGMDQTNPCHGERLLHNTHTCREIPEVPRVPFSLSLRSEG